MYPAAESIKESFPGMSDEESMFVEVLLWYGGFNDLHRLKVLPYRPDDIAVIQWKREDARRDGDFEMADSLRNVLLAAGVKIGDKSL